MGRRSECNGCQANFTSRLCCRAAVPMGACCDLGSRNYCVKSLRQKKGLRECSTGNMGRRDHPINKHAGVILTKVQVQERE